MLDDKIPLMMETIVGSWLVIFFFLEIGSSTIDEDRAKQRTPLVVTSWAGDHSLSCSEMRYMCPHADMPRVNSHLPGSLNRSTDNVQLTPTCPCPLSCDKIEKSKCLLYSFGWYHHAKHVLVGDRYGQRKVTRFQFTLFLAALLCMWTTTCCFVKLVRRITMNHS